MKNAKAVADDQAALVAAELRRKAREQSVQEAKDIAQFYMQNYDYVELVSCSQCAAELCLWVLDNEQVRANMLSHPMGLRRIVLGIQDTSLLSSRKRSDGSMGYRCKCGADTIHNEAEKQVIVEKGWPGVIPSTDPHVLHEIHKKTLAIDFKPVISTPQDNVTVIDGFVHTTLKNTVPNKEGAN